MIYGQWVDSHRVIMLCSIFVIALVLPLFTLAEEAKKGNRTEIVCDKPDVKKAGDEFFDCFNYNVEHSIYNNNSACSIVKPIINFVKVANNSCYNQTGSSPADERDSIEFVKLVQFSIKNGAFQDFVNSSGLECINTVKNKISECVKTHGITVEEPSKSNGYRKYDNLWKMTSLTIDYLSCKRTRRIKYCTQKAMRDEGYNKCKYDNDNILYVGLLFDFMLERCTRLIPNWMELTQNKEMHHPRNIDKAGTRTTHALLGVLLALAILAMFYVCVRDCRAPRGQWKAINERISMSILNRRRSLVNEACQGN